MSCHNILYQKVRLSSTLITNVRVFCIISSANVLPDSHTLIYSHINQVTTKYNKQINNTYITSSISHTQNVI